MVLRAHWEGRSSNRCGVLRGLVDNEVADEARLGVEDVALLLGVRRRERASGTTDTEQSSGLLFGKTEKRIGQPGERLVGRRELGLLKSWCGGVAVHSGLRNQVVALAVNESKTVRRE